MSVKIRWISSPLLLLIISIIIIIMSVSVHGDSYSPPPYPPPAPFKPSVIVVVAILTTVFSTTFLLLLYAKHCKRATNGYGGSPAPPFSAAAARKNSGVRRAVVESLPVFRFGSLRGPKDGLECAVCLSRFEPSEVLRLLPKCKHAFHVECVDTWLDAHSTCPLCRYRVDPEDILLVQEHSNPLQHHQSLPPPLPPPVNEEEDHRTQRVSGRHSSAGENINNSKLLQIILQSSSASRRSLDSSRINQKKRLIKPTSSSSSSLQNVPHNETRASFDKRRKDGLLLKDRDGSFEKRLEHRIMISNEQQQQQRWSDLQPSDLIYLRSEMIINDSNRRYSSARGSPNHLVEAEQEDSNGSDGRIVINPRSASEMVGVSRTRRSDDDENMRQRRNGHVAGLLSRWLLAIPNQRQRVDHSLPL